MDHVRAYYDEIFHDLAVVSKLQNVEAEKLDVERHRLIFSLMTQAAAAPPSIRGGRSSMAKILETVTFAREVAHFEPDVRPPRINPDRAKYTDSYKTTAAFLRWIEKAHDPEIVKKLNQSLREQKFKLELFKDYTGKTVDDLWQEFTDSLRARQKSAGR